MIWDHPAQLQRRPRYKDQLEHISNWSTAEYAAGKVEPIWKPLGTVISVDGNICRYSWADTHQPHSEDFGVLIWQTEPMGFNKSVRILVEAPPDNRGWGVSVTEPEDRIDPGHKQYRTRDGKQLIMLQVKLYHPTLGMEVTFPVKGSIDRGKHKQPEYCIWTLDGRHDFEGENKRDLIEYIPEETI